MLSCEGCDYLGYEQTAIAAGFGNHYVKDFRSNQLHRFVVRIPSPGEPWEAVPAPVDPWVQEQFDRVEEFLRLNGYAKNYRVDVPVTSPFMPPGFGNGNAYDVAYSGNVRTALGLALTNRLATSSSLLGNVANAIWAALSTGSAAATGEPLSLVIVIHWADGSQSAFIVDKDHLHMAGLVTGGSVDDERNVIPSPGAADEPRHFEGAWDFNSRANVDRWIRNAAMFGIPVGRSNGGALTCGMTCEGETGSCRITCTRR